MDGTERVRKTNTEWRRRNPNAGRNAYLLRTYGISESDYGGLLENQGGVCAVCREACKTGKRLAVDHCHITGKVRGLLCMNCNRALGYMQDSPALLRSAVEYLQRC